MSARASSVGKIAEYWADKWEYSFELSSAVIGSDHVVVTVERSYIVWPGIVDVCVGPYSLEILFWDLMFHFFIKQIKRIEWVNE